MIDTLLIVDDSKTQRMILKKMIALSGIPVRSIVEAGNGKEALLLVNSADVRCILTDLNMPVMTGEALIKTLKQHPGFSKIPIVVITSKGSESMKQELLQLGVSAIIAKPFEPETLAQVLSAIGGTP